MGQFRVLFGGRCRRLVVGAVGRSSFRRPDVGELVLSLGRLVHSDEHSRGQAWLAGISGSAHPLPGDLRGVRLRRGGHAGALGQRVRRGYGPHLRRCRLKKNGPPPMLLDIRPPNIPVPNADALQGPCRWLCVPTYPVSPWARVSCGFLLYLLSFFDSSQFLSWRLDGSSFLDAHTDALADAQR